jgi:hypothetical protein
VKVVALIGLFLVSSLATAADRSDKIKDLLDSQGLLNMYEQQIKTGRDRARQMADQILAQATASLNLTDQAKTQLNDVVQEFISNAMPTWTSQDVLDAWGKYYGSKFSDEELDLLTSFYRSPLGQKDVAATAEALPKLSADFQERYKSQLAKATDQYVKRLQQIMKDCNCKKPAAAADGASSPTLAK